MELKDYQKKLLKEGNRYTFANIFIEKYPELAKERGYKSSMYNLWIDFNEGLYTVWCPNGDKDFFDVEFNYTGTKEY